MSNSESEVALFGSTDHEVESVTEEGSVIEVPTYGLSSNPDQVSGIVHVSTSEGLFPMDPISNETSQEVRNSAIGTTEGQIVAPDVTVRGSDVYFEGPEGETRIGTRKRYDGNAYDPANPNAGSIELVHRYQDSGSMVVTNQNPDESVFGYQAHGSEAVNLFRATQDPSTGSPEERRILRDKLLIELKGQWGESVAIDLTEGSFEPVGDGVDAEKCSFFKEHLQAALSGKSAGVNVAQDDDGGLPGL